MGVQVYACEWNPHSREALALGLAANCVEGKCEVRPGDCTQASVCVGLIQK